MFRVRKVRILNKVLNEPAGCSLLAAFDKEEPSTETSIEDWKSLHELSYAMARKMGAIWRQEFTYLSSKKKRERSLVSDPDLLLQALKRAQLLTLV